MHRFVPKGRSYNTFTLWIIYLAAYNSAEEDNTDDSDYQRGLVWTLGITTLSELHRIKSFAS